VLLSGDVACYDAPDDLRTRILLMTRLHVMSRCCLVGTLLLAGSAAATTLPVCTTGTLASYIALDKTGGCTIGDYSFFRFTAPGPDVTGNAPFANPSQILVTPEEISQQVGFRVSAMVDGTNLFSIPNPTGSESVTYHIDYFFDPPAAGGGSLSLDPPFGDVTATQQYCLSDVFAGGCTLGTQAQISVTTADPFSRLTFPVPALFIDNKIDITLNASPGHPAGFDALTTLYNPNVTPVPEPANTVLTGIGLITFLLIVYIGAGPRVRKASI
jgi:hypothetical protein